MSPLQKWLDQLDITQGKFALAAGVSRPHVQHVASGQSRLAGKLREYIESLRPDVVIAQDAWREIQAKEVNKYVAEVAA